MLFIANYHTNKIQHMLNMFEKKPFRKTMNLNQAGPRHQGIHSSQSCVKHPAIGQHTVQAKLPEHPGKEHCR